MSTKWVFTGTGVVAAMSLALSLSPALGSHSTKKLALKQVSARSSLSGIGSFTPAAADPRLAAAFAHSGILSSGFRFTPSGLSSRLGHGVTVAVRTRASYASVATVARTTQPNATLAPEAYNLGVAVGWKKFALTGDYQKTDLGLIQGGREGADIGLSYNTHKWSSRIGVIADHSVAAASALGVTDDVAIDMGGSYRLTRNLDVTAGVRYKREHDRLEQFSDTRRDSQAVYVGTQFKF